MASTLTIRIGYVPGMTSFLCFPSRHALKKFTNANCETKHMNDTSSTDTRN